MIVKKSMVKRILVITLSNIGDIILTTPVIAALAEEFHSARIDVMAGPQGKELFSKDPRVTKVIIYDKHAPILKKRRLSLKLRKLKYDLIADLRNTIFPILLGARYRTSTIQKFPRRLTHKKDHHLFRLRCFGIDRMDTAPSVFIPAEDKEYIDALLEGKAIKGPIVVINAGAKSHLKRWTEEGFSVLCNQLFEECGVTPILIGQDTDSGVVERITKGVRGSFFSFVNMTNIRQLAGLLRRADLLITNDSAPLHLACAVGTKVLAIFGPTDPKKYGPTGEMDIVINKKLFCSPCEKAACQYDYECMRLISSDEVFQTAREMLEGYEI